MAPRGARGDDGAILVDDNYDGNSASERRSNDTDMVDSNKDLYFSILRDGARGAPSLKDEIYAGILQADLRPIHQVSS